MPSWSCKSVERAEGGAHSGRQHTPRRHREEQLRRLTFSKAIWSSRSDQRNSGSLSMYETFSIDLSCLAVSATSTCLTSSFEFLSSSSSLGAIVR
jgi:hypothetical protein